MAFEFTYQQGIWTETTLFPESGNDVSFEVLLDKLGYEDLGLVGAEFGVVWFSIYKNRESEAFIVSINLFDRGWYVLIHDLPNLMLFIREYAPAAILDSVNNLSEAINNVAKKLFLLQHGHDSDSICQKCDPEGWQIMMERRHKRSAKPMHKPSTD